MKEYIKKYASTHMLSIKEKNEFLNIQGTLEGKENISINECHSDISETSFHSDEEL